MPNEVFSGKIVASRSMCYCCFDTLIDALQRTSTSTSASANTSNVDGRSRNKFDNNRSDDSVQCPIFVSWEKCNNASSWQLRGCIGSLSPRLLTSAVAGMFLASLQDFFCFCEILCSFHWLINYLIMFISLIDWLLNYIYVLILWTFEEYAIISAFRDRRFKPVTISEVRSLRVSVSLLVDYEECNDVYDWTIGVHGILIKFVVNCQHYDATFLPEVAEQQRWGQQQTISSLIQKAGYNATITQELLTSIDCTRYQSSKCLSTYTEYVNDICKGIDPINITPSNEKVTTSRPWSFRN